MSTIDIRGQGEGIADLGTRTRNGDPPRDTVQVQLSKSKAGLTGPVEPTEHVIYHRPYTCECRPIGL